MKVSSKILDNHRIIKNGSQGDDFFKSFLLSKISTKNKSKLIIFFASICKT